MLDITDDQSVVDVSATGLQRTQLFDGIRSPLVYYDLLVNPHTRVDRGRPTLVIR